jgi:arsenate reductase (thioredoxin)
MEHIMEISIAFICIGNSCRSQMAEGFAKNLLKELKGFYDQNRFIHIYSAGTHPAYEVNPSAVTAMQEKGIDISSQYPKTLSEIPGSIDILISMGCGVDCPHVPSKYRNDWQIEDPVGMPADFFRKVRDIIEGKVNNLIKTILDSKSIEDAIARLK